MKTIAILGSTGSIGTQTLEVARANGDIRIAALAAGRNIKMLEQQIREFRPRIAAVWEEKDAKQLRIAVADLPVEILSGMDGLKAVAVCEESQILVTAIVGMIGILPTIEGIKAGKDIALANKETLVTAGHIIMPLAKKHHVQILPVDSEHSAIFQSLNGEEGKRIEKILLTASGGPFRGKTWDELQNVQLEDALKHPNWDMGAKVTIDSASMMNKGFEMIEARWLFDIQPTNIDILVHPESVVHSLVEFIDGSVKAQLADPDMRMPIRYALGYPERLPAPQHHLSLADHANLSFFLPDMEKFPLLRLAFDAIGTGGTAPTLLNAANEVAVKAFLQERIPFTDLYTVADSTLQAIPITGINSLDDIAEAHRLGTEAAIGIVDSMNIHTA